MKLPIIVSKNVHFNSLKGRAEFNCIPKLGMIKIGFQGVPIFDRRYSRTVLNIAAGSRIVFKGKCNIGSGSKIGVGGGVLLGKIST